MKFDLFVKVGDFRLPDPVPLPCHFLLVAGPMLRDQGPFRSGFLKHRIHMIIMHSDRQSPNSRTRSMLDFVLSGRGLCDNGMDDRGYQDHE